MSLCMNSFKNSKDLEYKMFGFFFYQYRRFEMHEINQKLKREGVTMFYQYCNACI